MKGKVVVHLEGFPKEHRWSFNPGIGWECCGHPGDLSDSDPWEREPYEKYGCGLVADVNREGTFLGACRRGRRGEHERRYAACLEAIRLYQEQLLTFGIAVG